MTNVGVPKLFHSVKSTGEGAARQRGTLITAGRGEISPKPTLPRQHFWGFKGKQTKAGELNQSADLQIS